MTNDKLGRRSLDTTVSITLYGSWTGDKMTSCGTVRSQVVQVLTCEFAIVISGTSAWTCNLFDLPRR